LLEAAKKLSPSDKLTVAVELWNEIRAHVDDIPLTDSELEELERRYAPVSREPR
jgi:putative addiction module component (TIGR02574 family)